jgi:hypothetical protein
MFTAMRYYYNFATIATEDALASGIGSTYLPGDRIFFRFTKHLYGTVNAAGNGIDLATA